MPAKIKHVVTVFLRNSGRILVLRRSGKVGTYRGKWAGISGYVEREPLQQAYIEIEEEAGIDRRDIRLVATGEPLEVEDPALETLWIVHPFLFDIASPERVRTDWEHVEAKWVPPEEVRHLDTVPGLAEALERVLKSHEQKKS